MLFSYYDKELKEIALPNLICSLMVLGSLMEAQIPSLYEYSGFIQKISTYFCANPSFLIDTKIKEYRHYVIYGVSMIVYASFRNQNWGIIPFIDKCSSDRSLYRDLVTTYLVILDGAKELLQKELYKVFEDKIRLLSEEEQKIETERILNFAPSLEVFIQKMIEINSGQKNPVTKLILKEIFGGASTLILQEVRQSIQRYQL
eukprot:TRINITY_DN11326_c0_g1_i1.p1 TRINITY_DN11326_c0_g1~~TRINITY_DN11326_c0_g1_i1.p1  ORF type:complete len:202 (+),score=35.84 TRINITY_DN11326_c0_g1_i1:475-1080(+)